MRTRTFRDNRTRRPTVDVAAMTSSANSHGRRRTLHRAQGRLAAIIRLDGRQKQIVIVNTHA